jgi:tyrosine-protein kinase Etk/Wzc
MSTQVTPGARGGAFSPLQPLPIVEDDVDLSQLTSFLRRHRRVFATCLLVGVVLSTIVAFAWPRSYTSSASFMPQGQSRLSSLASLASQFGVSVPSTDASRSPGFYATLLVSKNLLAEVVQRRFERSGDAGSIALMDYLGASGTTTDLRVQSAITKLSRKVTASVDQKPGLVRLEVTLHDPIISRDVARALIAQVDSFNLKSRQSQASAERRFTERRVAEAQAEARQAQDELQAFLQRNRDFRSSSQLNFAYDRLADNVSLRQQIYTSVAQAYEQARIEEVRDTPVITLVEAPMLPARPDSRPFGRAIVAGVLLSLIAARFLAVRHDRRMAAEE